MGGCTDALCVVPLCRGHHRMQHRHELDLLPFLVDAHVAELQHALAHHHGDLLGLLHHLTGQRWAPAGVAA
jgi:hypothetical protein